jgi:MFS family permease
MTEAPQGDRIFYGRWITVLMLYYLIFAGGFGLYGFPVYVPRFMEEFGWSLTQVTSAASAWAIVYGFSGPLIGVLIQRLGARKWLTAATVACAGSFLLISMIGELWQLYACVGLLGITIGGTTLVPAQTVVTTWFNQKRGRAMGIVMMGIGIGGLCIPPLITVFIKGVGWRGSWRLSALIYLVLLVPPLLLFLRNRPSDVGQLPDGADPGGSAEGVSQAAAGVSVKRVVRSPAFWLLFAIYVLHLYVMSAVAIHAQAFAEQDAGYTMTTAALFMSFAVGCSIPARFLFGRLADRFSPQYVMAAAGLFLVTGPLALNLFVINLGWPGLPPILIFALFQGMGIAGSATVLPLLTGRCFGPRNFAKIIGLVMAGFALGALFGAPITALIRESTGSYETAWAVCTAVAAVSVVLALLIRPTALHGEFEEEPTAA